MMFLTRRTQGFCGDGLFLTDLDKLDNEKKDLIQSDIAALHQFYSRHLEFPDHSSLVVLFAQVRMPAPGKTAFPFPSFPSLLMPSLRHRLMKTRGDGDGIYLTRSWTLGR